MATLYGHLGVYSRGTIFILGRHYRVVEVTFFIYYFFGCFEVVTEFFPSYLEFWAFKHLFQFPMGTKHVDPTCVPCYACWLPNQQKPRSPLLSLPAWRQVLDWLMVDQVSLSSFKFSSFFDLSLLLASSFSCTNAN